MQTTIRTGQTCAPDARQAAQEFHSAVMQPDMAFVIFFCSIEYDLGVLAEEISALFSGTPVLGCTTAGEIGPAGGLQRSITGASFPAGDFVAAIGMLNNLQDFEFSQGEELIQRLLQEIECREPVVCRGNRFALQLIDGLSVREEPVTSALQHALDRIPLIGGSAADGLRFVETFVYADGRFHSDSAVLVLVSTATPFTTFTVQHFLPTEQRAVVTRAEPATRIVREIDGMPAAEEYARLVGVDISELGAAVFAAHPVVVRVGGSDYVRSVQQANEDGSLTFYSAIEEGIVLRVAHGGDMLASFEEALESVREELGGTRCLIGFDCVLRQNEASASGLTDRITETYRQHNAVGFNTYGEQCHGIHINQTLTGIAFGVNDGAQDG